jgi:hypothetical protein
MGIDSMWEGHYVPRQAQGSARNGQESPRRSAPPTLERLKPAIIEPTPVPPPEPVPTQEVVMQPVFEMSPPVPGMVVI